MLEVIIFVLVLVVWCTIGLLMLLLNALSPRRKPSIVFRISTKPAKIILALFDFKT